MTISLSNPNTTAWGTPLPTTAPKPTTTAIQLPGGIMPVLKPSINVASTAPKPTVPAGAITPTSTPTPAPAPYTPPAGFQDIRSQLVTNQPSALGTQASGQLSQAMSQAAQQANLPQYGAVAGPDYGQANQYLQQAGAAAGQVNAGGIQGQQVAAPNYQQAVSMLQQALASSQSPESQQLRGTLMSQLSGLSSSPDRAQLAANALQLQRQLTQPQWEQDLRAVGQKAAAFGRVGSGMTTNELTDVTLAREKALGLYGQQLANDAAGLQMQDRLNVFGAGQGLQGQFTGQDQSRAGLMSNLGSQYTGMANATTANAQENANRDLSAAQARASVGLNQAGLLAGLGGQAATMAGNTAQFGAQQQAAQIQQAQQRAMLQQSLLGQLAGVQGQTFNQGMSEAGLRTQQQQWQNQLSQQNIGNQVTQQQLQDQLLNSQFQRQLAAAQAAGQFGYANDPYGLLLSGSQAQQQNATSQQQQLAQLAQQQAYQQLLAQQQAAAGRSGMPTAPAGQAPGTYYYGS